MTGRDMSEGSVFYDLHYGRYQWYDCDTRQAYPDVVCPDGQNRRGKTPFSSQGL